MTRSTGASLSTEKQARDALLTGGVSIAGPPILPYSARLSYFAKSGGASSTRRSDALHGP